MWRLNWEGEKSSEDNGKKMKDKGQRESQGNHICQVIQEWKRGEKMAKRKYLKLISWCICLMVLYIVNQGLRYPDYKHIILCHYICWKMDINVSSKRYKDTSQHTEKMSDLPIKRYKTSAPGVVITCTQAWHFTPHPLPPRNAGSLWNAMHLQGRHLSFRWFTIERSPRWNYFDSYASFSFMDDTFEGKEVG